MIKGTGVDIIEISRIEKSLTNEKFVERIFTKKNRNIVIPENKWQFLLMQLDLQLKKL